MDAKGRDWFKYPMKPARVSETLLSRMDVSQYMMELKYDGFRAVLTVSDTVTFWTREKRVLDLPRELSEQVASLGLPDGTVLDGEVWSPAKRGGWKGGQSDPCLFTTWDVVRFGFQDLGGRPIEERKKVLQDAIGEGTSLVSIVPSSETDLEKIGRAKEMAERMRTERDARSGYIHGVVLKRKGSPRRDHSTRCVEHPDWLKVVFSGMEGWEPRSMKCA